jgi:hypothetical protein
LQLTASPVQTTGTLSSGCQIASNSPVAGQLLVGCDVVDPLVGAGTLLNLQFTVTGTANSTIGTSNLSFQSFVYNGGQPTVEKNNGSFSVSAANNCSVVISLAEVFPSSGASQTLSVTTANGCTWTASTTDSFITITNEVHNANGSLTFTVAANTNATPRSGTITINGQTLTINQAAGVKSRKRTRFF